MKIFEEDNISIEVSDERAKGKKSIGDMVMQFKNRKYPISVARKENIATKSLEAERDDSDILLLRKNRKSWKVYMDLNTLLILLLNNRS